MRAVGYFRPDSRDASEPGLASAPRRQFEQYCRDRGHQLVQLIGPQAAGQDPPLTDVQQFAVLAGVCADEKLRPDLVLVPDGGHLADDLETCLDRVLSLESQGIEIRCMSSPLADILDSAMRLLKASPRNSGRASRIREAITSKARRGEVLGRTPYGYRAGLDGLLEPVPSEAEVVREIFVLYAGGTDVGGKQRLGLRRIAARLNEGGIRTRSGGHWTPASLAGLLRNPAYAGEYKRGKVRILGNHPAIIDRAAFERAQAARLTRRPQRRARSAKGYLLAGLAECAGCQRTMHGLLRERKWKRKDGTEVRRSYRYYECPARPQSGPSRGLHASRGAEALERAVFERIDAFAGSEDASGIGATVSGAGGTTSKSSRDGIGEAVRRLRSAAMRVAAGNGQISEFTAARAELKKRRARGAADSVAPAGMSVRKALEAATSQDRALARRAVIALVARVTVEAAAVEVRLRLDASAPPPA